LERSCKIDTTPKSLKLLSTAIVHAPAGLAGPQLRGRSEGDGVGGLEEEVEGKDKDPWD